ncbi:unnamed protein product [Coccothraustes coccothraustes]
MPVHADLDPGLLPTRGSGELWQWPGKPCSLSPAAPSGSPGHLPYHKRPSRQCQTPLSHHRQAHASADECARLSEHVAWLGSDRRRSSARTAWTACRGFSETARTACRGFLESMWQMRQLQQQPPGDEPLL